MHEKEYLIKVVELEEAIVGMRSDGIGHVYFKPGTDLTIELQHRLIDAYNEITGGKKHPFVFEAGEYVTITKEARNNAVQLEEISPLSATVVIVENLAYKLIAEFYYKFNKPQRPYKMVTSFQDGIKWIHSNRISFPLSGELMNNE